LRTSIALALTVLYAGLAGAQRTIDVRPGHSPSLAEAVRQARAGDRVVVARGVYHEPTIVIDRSITLVGEPGAVLDGSAATHIVRVEANDVVIRGLTFQNVRLSHVEDRAAIRVGKVRGCRIEDNRLINAFFGIYLAGTEECDVSRNTLSGRPARSEDVSGNGIHLWTARGIRIADNRITGHRDGIYLEFAHNSVVTGNTSERNLRYGLHFMSSDDCAYTGNTFRANQAGVAVMYARRVAMTHNQFVDNWGASAYGLLLKEIYDSRVDSNAFARNTTALFADGATRMQARNNAFTDNGWAVKLMASTESAELTGNIFAGNTFDIVTNNRGSSNVLRRNYWDRYEGYDLDRDGVGDVPHRPVRLFSLIVENNEPTMLMLRSAIIALLDRAERLLPSLTPETLVDTAPLMRRPR
jgi:nitrous oxidase accessory protein